MGFLGSVSGGCKRHFTPQKDKRVPLREVDLSELEGESLREQCIPQHLPKEVLRARALRLALQQISARKAAPLLGISYETARRIYADPSFQADVRRRIDLAFEDVDAAYAERNKTLHEKIAEKGERAFQELIQLMEDPNTLPGHRIKIAQDILDRNEDTQAGKIIKHTNLDIERLRMAGLAAREMDNVIPIRKKA